MANKFAFVFIFVFLASCGSNRKKVDDYIAMDIASIKVNLDSAAYLYDEALRDVSAGLSHDSVVHKYEDSIKKYFKAISVGVDSLGKLYTQGEIDSVKYEALVKSINAEKAEEKAEELKRNGIVLNLK
jgi:hypothetical protein